jgi:hypothetical protein
LNGTSDEPKTRPGVPLGVKINQKNRLIDRRQRCAYVHGRGGLANPALLIRKRNYLGQYISFGGQSKRFGLFLQEESVPKRVQKGLKKCFM